MPDQIQNVCGRSSYSYGDPVYDSSKTTVHLGENNLADVARSRGLDPQAVLAENPQIDGLYAPLFPGQEIQLPVCQQPAPATEPAKPAPSTAGDPLAKSAVQANIKQPAALPPDEASIKAALGDQALRNYQQTKAETATEFKQARQTYLQTGKVPPLKHHAPIEIKAGVQMTLSQRYDLNLIHQGRPPDYPRYIGADTDYLTSDEFREEWTARATKEMRACDENNTRPDTKDRCGVDVKEKYMGKDYMEASWAATAAAWNEGAYIENLKNSGPLNLAGRVVGRSAGYLIAGDKGADKGEEIGAFVGGIGDVAVAVKSGSTARARINAYRGSAGLELPPEPPAEVAGAPKPPPSTEVQPDAPGLPATKVPEEQMSVAHGTDTPGFNNMGGLGPGRIRVDHSPGAGQDFGQGFYLSVGADKAAVGNAERFGDLRVAQRGSAPRQVMAWEVNRSELGDVVDVRPGGEQAAAWNNYLQQPLAPNVKMTIGDYIRTTGVEHRGEYFEKFLTSIGKQNADVVIGPIGTPETAGVVKQPGTQMAIRSQRVADRLNAKMTGKPDTPPTTPPPPPKDAAPAPVKPPLKPPVKPPEGSGTSVHNPRASANTPSEPPFDKGEELIIKSYVDAGKTRAEAEQIVRESRKPENKVTWERPNSPNSGGTTRVPDWKKPGPGKKKP